MKDSFILVIGFIVVTAFISSIMPIIAPLIIIPFIFQMFYDEYKGPFPIKSLLITTAEIMLWIWLVVHDCSMILIILSVIVYFFTMAVLAPSKTNHVADLVTYVNTMNGIEFEKYCANLLRANKFKNIVLTQISGDHGVDIIAEKDRKMYAFQCKRYSSPLGNKPVQEVYAGKTFYNCDIAVVMTNSTFTAGAVSLAQATGVQLWDGQKLMELSSNADISSNI